MSKLADRLVTGELILIDGATGTDIERRGVPMTQGAWCGGSQLTHPDDVRAVHVAHIEAGAELIVANTFASSKHLLAYAGIENQFEDLNRIAIELAIEAREQTGRAEVTVAGSISTSAQGGPIAPLDVQRANFLEQGQILADAGADLIVLEMMRDIDQTEAALAGALATGLPVWMGISCAIDGGVPMMWGGTVTVDDFVQHFKNESIELIAVMHTEVEDVDACLDVIDQHWKGPVGVYAHSGLFEHPVWVFIDVISPESYTEACLRWVDRGVQVVGGCCGIGHEHIAHLRPRISAKAGAGPATRSSL